jgi:zinc protease
MTSRFRAIIGAVCLLFAVLAISVGEVDAQTSKTASTRVRPLSYTRVVLPNGLVAIFNEDHTSPTIGTMVSYQFGAKDEPEGKLGYAHLCEHLMFLGSANVPANQFMATMRSIGATSVRWGETSEDRTVYYHTIPSNQLETWMWLESDRMNMPFASVDTSQLTLAKGNVRSERQQARENDPFGFANTVTLTALYGPTLRDPLQSQADVDRASFSAVRAFCEPYYVPANAVVAISGDFQTAKARAMVEKYFGSIKRSPAPKRIDVRPEQWTGDRRLVLEDARSRAPRLRIAWPGVGFANPDRQALLALAEALRGDRSSGLTKALVVDRPLATGVVALHAEMQNGGVFEIEVFPRDSTPLGVIEDVVDSVLRAFRTAPANERSLLRYKRANAVLAITSLQSRFARADTLAQGEQWAGDPVAYASQVDRANTVTHADLLRVADKYLTPNRVVLSMIPAGKLDLVSKPERKFDTIVP